MDEENENENEESAAEKNAKKIGKDVAKKTGKAISKAGKAALKKIIAALGIKFVLALFCIVALAIVVSSVWWGIKSRTYKGIYSIAEDVTDDSSGEIKKITEIDGRKYKINDELFKEKVEEWLENNHVSKEALGLKDDLSILTKFLESEVVTSYPDLRQRDKIGTPVPEGELQGLIQFNRKYEDDTEELLEYMPYEEYRKEIAKFGLKIDDEETQEQIYFEKSEILEGYNKMKRYFTLDEEKNLIVINIVTTEKTVTYSDYAKEEGKSDAADYLYLFDIEVTRADFQSVVAKYTMPFEFSLAMLMTSQNQRFCEEVAKLAKDSKIVIDVHDNVTKVVKTETYSYTADFRFGKFIKYYIVTRGPSPDGKKKGPVTGRVGPYEYDPYPVEDKATLQANPYKVTVYSTKNMDIKLCITEALTWIVDYTAEYKYVKNTPEIPDEIVLEPDDASEKDVPDYHKLLSRLKISLPEDAEVCYEQSYVYERQYNKKTVIKTEVEEDNYVKSSFTTKEKPEKFLSLIKINTDTGIFDLKDLDNNDKYIKYLDDTTSKEVSPERNILSGKEALYKLLGSCTKTQDLESIMRHVINIYLGKEKATPEVTEYVSEDKQDEGEVEIYEPDEFQYIEGGWSALWQNNYTRDQFIELVKKYTPPDSRGNGARSYREYYIKHFVANAGNYFDIAKKYGLDPMFIFCIGIHESEYGTSNISFKKGNFWGWGAYDSSPFRSAISFEGDASKGIEAVCKGISQKYVNPSGTWYNWIKAKGYEPSTIEGVGARYASDANWAASIKKYIQTIFGVTGSSPQGIDTSGINSETVLKMVNWAQAQLGKTSFYNTAKGQNQSTDGNCARFVKSAYFEAGLGYIDGHAKDVPHPNAITYTSTGKVDWSKIPVGACIVSKGSNSAYGHVALYVGNGYVIEAGGKGVIQQQIDRSYGRGKFLGWGYATKSQNISL